MENSSKVRLTETERIAIRDAISEATTANGVNWLRIGLFGSRADPQRKGGDIDLWIELNHATDASTQARLKRKIRVELANRLGEQKIDVVLDSPEMATNGFLDNVRKEKKVLWKQKT